MQVAVSTTYRSVVTLSLLLSVGAVGCSGGSGGGGSASTSSGSTGTGTPTPPLTNVDPTTWPHPRPPRAVERGTFATSTNCWNCHGPDTVAMRDSAGRDVSPYSLWQASMMANAARDPLWRAEVSVEMAATPSLAAAIETKCLSCHTPMGVADAASYNQRLTLAELDGTSDRAQLALDGVSCALCHEIEPTQDVESTFGGHYTLNQNREIYGPHANPDQSPMAIRLGFLPTESQHVTQSELCASCHTLYTDAARADGTLTGGRLPEQTPFLEWRNSVFSGSGPNAASCQACHTPSADEDNTPIATQIARASLNTVQRSTYGRHTFVGGNTLVPQILRDQAADLSPLAPAAAFDELIAATRSQLQNKTATISLGSINRVSDDLIVPVTVVNLAGHKFPTGHPVRRAWVRMIVRDGQGRVVFASGEHDATGRILGSRGALLGSELAGGPSQPHFPLISSPDQVQIYESLMADAQGDLTYLLLRGESYLKDNRLLPQGWDPAHPDAADTAPQGVTEGDFQGGQDMVLYRIKAPSSKGPYQVEATLFYQPLSARFAAELFEYRTPEVDAFRTYYEAADRRPEQVGRVSRYTP